jgi:tripartite-type tricarboxylate transporter receptor subunit TctC
MKRVWMIWLATVILAPPCAPMPVNGADFYEGKTVTILVGYKPGGGYDRTARILARHLGKHIPGRPAVIVQNMPGASSIVAANHLYRVARPDGLTLGTFNRNLPLAQLARLEGVRFDMTRFVWIGSAGSESTILALRTGLGYRTFDALRAADREVVIGSTGVSGSNYDFPILLRELLGVKLKIVSGYTSSADIMLAIERGEVDGRAGSYASLRPFIHRGLVHPLIRGRATELGIEALPVDEDLAPTPDARRIMALRSAPDVIGRAYVMPPGTPVELVRTMREAFARAIRDPELKDEAAQAQTELEHVPGEEALRIVQEILAQPKEIVQEFLKHVTFGD